MSWPHSYAKQRSQYMFRRALCAVLLISAVVIPNSLDATARVAQSTTGRIDARSGDRASEQATPLPKVGLDAPEMNGLEITEPPPDPVTIAIDRLLEDEPGVYGVVLMDPDGTVIYSRNADTPFVSASLYKLILMADICRAVDDGTISLDTGLYIDASYYSEIDGTDSYFDTSYAGYDTTVEEALFATGAYSSNVAAKALLTLTTTEDLNATAAALGLDETYLFTDPRSTPNWPPSVNSHLTKDQAAIVEAFVLSYATDGEVNLTTPGDMARFFQLLLRGRIFNKQVSTLILDILKKQVVDNRFPVLLPPDTELAHKTGNLDFVVHDVGVIYSPNGTKILAAMVEAQASDVRAAAVVQRLALIAYGTLDVPAMPELATPVGDGSGFDAELPVPVTTPVP